MTLPKRHPLCPASTARNPRAGLTLVELLVVLVILAILTTIAVQATDGLLLQSRYDATQRTLQGVQNAIGQAAITNDSSAPFAGFVADTGRLPKITQENRGTLGNVLTMSELWTRPSDASLLFGFKPAPAPDADVLVPCGWKGPYVVLPASGTRLLDGWGTELVTPLDPVGQAKDFPYSCLRDPLTDTGFAAAGQYSQILIRSPGRNKTANIADLDYDRDAEIRFNIADYQAWVLGTVEVNLIVTVLDKDGNAVTDASKIKDATDRTKSALTGGSASMRVFGPDPVTGQVAVYPNPIPLPLLSGQASFNVVSNGTSALTAGPRILRAYCTSLTYTQPSDFTITNPAFPVVSLQVPLSLRTGANVTPLIRISVPVVAKFNS